MKTRPLICMLLVLCAAMPMAGGCARMEGLGPPPIPGAANASHTSPRPELFFVRKPRADDVLIYFQNVLAMPAAQQIREFDQARVDFARSGKAEDRLRLICLALLPGRPFTERAYASKLLDEYLVDPQRDQGGLEALAALVKLLVNDQRGMQKQLSAEKERAEGLARQLNEQKTQLDELRTQLNELKKIEKIIRDREKAGLPEKR